MAEKWTCDHCHEEFEGQPVRRGDKVYCCDACAFEAGRSKDCGGRSDTTFSKPAVEQA
jgi:hypothetical protein